MGLGFELGFGFGHKRWSSLSIFIVTVTPHSLVYYVVIGEANVIFAAGEWVTRNSQPVTELIFSTKMSSLVKRIKALVALLPGMICSASAMHFVSTLIWLKLQDSSTYLQLDSFMFLFEHTRFFRIHKLVIPSDLHIRLFFELFRSFHQNFRNSSMNFLPLFFFLQGWQILVLI